MLLNSLSDRKRLFLCFIFHSTACGAACSGLAEWDFRLSKTDMHSALAIPFSDSAGRSATAQIWGVGCEQPGVRRGIHRHLQQGKRREKDQRDRGEHGIPSKERVPSKEQFDLQQEREEATES